MNGSQYRKCSCGARRKKIISGDVILFECFRCQTTVGMPLDLFKEEELALTKSIQPRN